MTKGYMETTLRELIAEYANADGSKIKRFLEHPSGTNLVEDLSYDSISLIALIAELEECLGLDMDDDVLLGSFDTYDGILEYIMEKAGADK